jgi:uncharacterized protein
MSVDQKTTPIVTVEETKPESAKSVSQESKTFAIISHLGGLVFGLFPMGVFLGFIPSLIILLVKTEDKFVKEESKEALNFQITLIFGYLISYALMLIVIGFLTYFALFVINIVFAIIAAIAVSDGKSYKYPFSVRLIK